MALEALSNVIKHNRGVDIQCIGHFKLLFSLLRLRRCPKIQEMALQVLFLIIFGVWVGFGSPRSGIQGPGSSKVRFWVWGWFLKLNLKLLFCFIRLKSCPRNSLTGRVSKNPKSYWNLTQTQKSGFFESRTLKPPLQRVGAFRLETPKYFRN